MYRSILISFLAGSMMAIFSASAQAQKAPKPAASNLNSSRSNIYKVKPPPPGGESSGIAVSDPGTPADKLKRRQPQPKTE